EHQRRFAATPPGAVIDGRDIGTVVCPDAAVKLYLTADVAERARRRHAELTQAGGAPSMAEVRAEIEARDRRDEERAVAPMKPAPDAIVLDTSALDLEGVFRAALAVVCPRLAAIEAAGTSCDSGPGPL
ncbi:MAG: (d)CMP kinase, partial [Alphaproteobacteria bacterium]